MKQPKAKSSIIYSGASLIDGSPIVVVALLQSGNAKTGNMVQTYIIRSDVDPLTASKSGLDYAICGNCVHRGTATDKTDKKQAENRTCYVTLYHGPLQVYKAFSKGNYPIASDNDIQTLGKGRMVRLGTYGDPAAVPQSVWDKLLSSALGHTGYTHQNSVIGLNPDYSKLMYSADNKADAINAHNKGLRTFRVIPVSEYEKNKNNSLLSNEILCPASAEMEYKTTCDKCKLCSGNTIKAKSIAIVAHGTAKSKVV